MASDEKIGMGRELKEYLGPDVNKSRLAIELDVSRGTLDRWIRRPVELTRLDRMRKMARLSGIPMEKLFELYEEQQTA